MKIGVIVAFNEEIGTLSNHGEIKSKAGVPYAEVKFGDNEAILALCGIGPSNAAACTQLLISGFGCEAILNVGLAGNASSLPIFGAVVADKAVFYDIRMDYLAECYPSVEEFIPDEEMGVLAKEILSKMNVSHIEGTVATGNLFVDSTPLKNSIKEKTSCSCIEMEGAAIAHIARKNDIPFCLVKIISDTAEEGGNDQFHDTLKIPEYIEQSTSFIRNFCESM